MIQAALPLDWPDQPHAPFIVTPSNAVAVRHLGTTATWPVRSTLLTGPRKSGRSLLGRTFVGRTGGVLIDDADRHDEHELFTAWNEAQSGRRPLLLIAEAAPPSWEIALPDLASRIAATPVVTISPPDEAWTAQVLRQIFERRGMTLLPDVLAYIVPRAPRSHHGVIALIDALDSAALARRSAITIPLARSVMLPLFDGAPEAS